MKETVVVDKEMLMKLLRACAENYGFEMCEFCDEIGCSTSTTDDNCANGVFKKLTEVK